MKRQSTKTLLEKLGIVISGSGGLWVLYKDNLVLLGLHRTMIRHIITMKYISVFKLNRERTIREIN